MIEINDIHLIDCIDGLKKIDDQSVDLILVDPPYELETHGGGDRKQWKNIHNNFIEKISSGFDYDSVFNEFIRICKTPNILIFCSNKQISKTMGWFENNKLSTTLLVWHKENYVPFANGKHMSDLEFIIYVRGKNAHFNNNLQAKKKSKLISENWRINKKVHPAQKSEDIISHLINLHSFENDLVVDCFSGSGTTAVVCKKMNRNFICMEIDHQYYEISKVRLKKIKEESYD